MKKLLLSTLLASALLNASDCSYELTPVAGYLWNSTSDETNPSAMGGVDNHGVIGLEAQLNGVSNLIKPELSLLYGRDQAAGYSGKTGVWTTAINGVYEMSNVAGLTPFAKAGVGYEVYSNTHTNGYNGFVLDAGMGAKMSITKSLALKLEALYLYKMNNNDVDSSNGEVHNVAALAGLTFKFGGDSTPKPEPKPEAKVEPKPEPKSVVIELVPIEAPATPVPVVTPEPAVAAAPAVETVATSSAAAVILDSDKDGVTDDKEKCPGTPEGFKVDSDGCPLTATLHLNFATSSNAVDAEGVAKVQAFGAFLKDSPAYKASIVGHTDSVGKDAGNQRLSERRAAQVKKMLVDQGVEENRLSASGKGESMPVATNATKEGRAQNRRIEVELSH